MHRLTSVMCWLILGTGLVLAQPAEQAKKQLEGTWIATKAERNGKAADDVVLELGARQFRFIKKKGYNLGIRDMYRPLQRSMDWPLVCAKTINWQIRT